MALYHTLKPSNLCFLFHVFFSISVGMLHRRYAHRMDYTGQSFHLLRSGQIQTTKEGFHQQNWNFELEQSPVENLFHRTHLDWIEDEELQLTIC